MVMNGAGVRMRNARDARVSDCGEENPDPRPADGGVSDHDARLDSRSLGHDDDPAANAVALAIGLLHALLVHQPHAPVEVAGGGVA